MEPTAKPVKDKPVDFSGKIPVKSMEPKKVSFPVQLLITLLLLAFLFGTSLFVAYRIGSNTEPPNDYEECVRSKGSIIQESYPAVCVTKDGTRFTQEISEEDEKFCGGIANILCPEGYVCRLDGNFPDAGGVCVRN